jgi:hypothetical protein
MAATADTHPRGFYVALLEATGGRLQQVGAVELPVPMGDAGPPTEGAFLGLAAASVVRLLVRVHMLAHPRLRRSRGGFSQPRLGGRGSVVAMQRAASAGPAPSGDARRWTAMGEERQRRFFVFVAGAMFGIRPLHTAEHVLFHVAHRQYPQAMTLCQRHKRYAGAHAPSYPRAPG